MCTYYKVTATMTNGVKEWKTTVYDGYNTAEEAAEAASRFFKQYRKPELKTLSILIERYTI